MKIIILKQVNELKMDNNDLNLKINKLEVLATNRDNYKNKTIVTYKDKYENKENDIKVFEKYIKYKEMEDNII